MTSTNATTNAVSSSSGVVSGSSTTDVAATNDATTSPASTGGDNGMMTKVVATAAVVVAGVAAVGLLAGFAWTSRSSTGAAPCMKGLRPIIQTLDLDRYTGAKWLEHLRAADPPLHFEDSLINVTAQYTKKSNGFIDVRNGGYAVAANGTVATKETVSNGEARATTLNGVLLVSFFPFVEAAYVILYLDSGYTMSIVGSPDRKFLWLLLRSTTPPTPAQRTTFTAVARRNGYPESTISSMISVSQITHTA